MLAIFAGVFEMIGRIAAAVFLFPAYFHVRKKTYQLYHMDPEGPDPE